MRRQRTVTVGSMQHPIAFLAGYPCRSTQRFVSWGAMDVGNRWWIIHPWADVRARVHPSVLQTPDQESILS
jgi:hypothetical protein